MRAAIFQPGWISNAPERFTEWDARTKFARVCGRLGHSLEGPPSDLIELPQKFPRLMSFTVRLRFRDLSLGTLTAGPNDDHVRHGDVILKSKMHVKSELPRLGRRHRGGVILAGPGLIVEYFARLSVDIIGPPQQQAVSRAQLFLNEAARRSGVADGRRGRRSRAFYDPARHQHGPFTKQVIVRKHFNGFVLEADQWVRAPISRRGQLIEHVARGNADQLLVPRLQATCCCCFDDRVKTNPQQCLWMIRQFVSPSGSRPG
jgi:hypothetical protein